MFLIHVALRMTSLLVREDGDMSRVGMWNVNCVEREGGSNMNFPEKTYILSNPSYIFLSSWLTSLDTCRRWELCRNILFVSHGMERSTWTLTRAPLVLEQCNVKSSWWVFGSVKSSIYNYTLHVYSAAVTATNLRTRLLTQHSTQSSIVTWLNLSYYCMYLLQIIK